MTTITIRECKSDGHSWTSRHRTSDADTAVARAITRHWGRSASLWVDRGLTHYPDSTRYGQVVEPAGVGSYNCITGRVRLDIE